MEQFNKHEELYYLSKKKGKEVLNRDLNNLLADLNGCFCDYVKEFFKFCFAIFRIKNWFKANNYCFDKSGNPVKSVTIFKRFGISESQVSRCVNCLLKYSFVTYNESGEATGYAVKEEFKDFSKSRLIVLLPVELEVLIADIKLKVVRPDMTVRRIKEYVKNYLFKLKKEEDELISDESDDLLPPKYDGKRYYTIEELERFTKDQLIQIAFELQCKVFINKTI